MLDEGASTNFTIIPPTNQSPWRLLFLVYPDQGRSAKNIIRVVVGISCLSIGLMPRFERLPYDIENDWIEDEK